MKQVIPAFGMGFYTAPDIARILDLKPPNVRYWFRTFVKNEFEKTTRFRYYYDYDNITTVSFSTLIEIYVFDFLRHQKISTKKIVIAHKELADYFNSPFPFCHYDILMLSGKDIIYNLESFLTISGTGFQHAIKEYLLPYSQKIEFQNNYANKYYPLGKDHSIVINPYNQFGNPIIDGTNIQTYTLSSLYRGGEKIEVISRLYNLTLQQVRDALEFDKAA